MDELTHSNKSCLRDLAVIKEAYFASLAVCAPDSLVEESVDVSERFCVRPVPQF